MTDISINLPGVTNARQLGGYRIGDKYVKKDVLLRTGALRNAEPEAVSTLEKKYKLQYVVDFRMDQEATINPDPKVGGAEKVHLSVFESEEPGNAEENKEFLRKYSDPTLSAMERFTLLYDEDLVNDRMYIDFISKERGITAYREFFKRLLSLDENRAVLWHCTDGKDRTGIASMLILSVFGAAEELIFEDYLLTNEFNKNRLDNIRKEAEPNNLSAEQLDALLFISGGVSRAYMKNAIDFLIKNYGSVLGFIKEELQVSDEGIALLKEKFLTE